MLWLKMYDKKLSECSIVIWLFPLYQIYPFKNYNSISWYCTKLLGNGSLGRREIYPALPPSSLKQGFCDNVFLVIYDSSR